MNKENALKIIATHGYNVGYGAKKHFATYDIIEKVPGTISFASIAFGILSLKYFNQHLESHVAVFLTLFGVISLYISCYQKDKNEYDKVGRQLTGMFSNLQTIYYRIKNNDEDPEKNIEEAQTIMAEFYQISIGKQILFSDWYAHYKFFVQTQIDWIDEQKNFSLIKDKIPRSFLYLLILSIITCVIVLYRTYYITA